MARMPDGFVIIPKFEGIFKNDEGKLEARFSTEDEELVMCKNCIYYDVEPQGDKMMCSLGLGWTHKEDYCSRGERRKSE